MKYTQCKGSIFNIVKVPERNKTKNIPATHGKIKSFVVGFDGFLSTQICTFDSSNKLGCTCENILLKNLEHVFKSCCEGPPTSIASTFSMLMDVSNNNFRAMKPETFHAGQFFARIATGSAYYVAVVTNIFFG